MYITGNRHFCKLKLFETFVSKVVRFEIAIMRNVNNRKITVFTKMAFHTIFFVHFDGGNFAKYHAQFAY